MSSNGRFGCRLGLSVPLSEAACSSVPRRLVFRWQWRGSQVWEAPGASADWNPAVARRCLRRWLFSCGSREWKRLSLLGTSKGPGLCGVRWLPRAGPLAGAGVGRAAGTGQ